MPLQNRVDPTGRIMAVADRGTFMGNRGGRIHTPDKVLTRRRWASQAWIICVTEFRGRHRQLMQPNSYTELFFLDEATALAAGHRPCFECRRADAMAYACAWAEAYAFTDRPRAHEMDAVLHRERLNPDKSQKTYEADLDGLPDGVVVRFDDRPHLVLGNRLLPWSFGGYGPTVQRPTGQCVTVLTPAPTVAALGAGYAAALHSSAGAHT